MAWGYNYQFLIYPTGYAGSYKNIVNSADGVSAIQDAMMGINENSMSGVAEYIVRIKNYVNTTNVGSGSIEIASGYFKSLGHIDDSRFIMADTTPTNDRIVSGVQNAYISTLDLKAISGSCIGYLLFSSGTFYNMIIDDPFSSNNPEEYVSNVVVDDESSLMNSYSGYFPDFGYWAEEDYTPPSIPTSGFDINADDLTTWPYEIKSSGAILGDIIFKYGYRYPGLLTNGRGIIRGGIICDKLFIDDKRTITSSGNITIGGKCDIDASNITINESILNITSHDHNNVTSSGVSAASFNSDRTITSPFRLSLVAGNVEAKRIYTNNGMGISKSWEEVTDVPINNPKNLYTLRDKLVATNAEVFGEVYGKKYIPEGIDPAYIAGVAPISFAGNNGTGSDELVLIYTKPTEADSEKIEDRICLGLWPSKREFPEITLPTDGVYAYGGGASISYLNPNKQQGAVRAYGNVYFSVFGYATYSEGGDTTYVNMLYEIDKETLAVKAIGGKAIDDGYIGPDATMHMPQLPMFEYEGNVVLPYIREGTSVGYRFGASIYNPVYQPLHLTELTELINGWIDCGMDTNPTKNTAYSGLNVGNIQTRFPCNTVTYAGRKYMLLNDRIYKVSNDNGFPYFHMALMPYRIGGTYSNPISANIASYAGKLWIGTALERSMTYKGDIKYHQRHIDTLQEIMGSTDCFVYSPVVHDGYLYAIAVNGWTAWKAETFSSYYEMSYEIPNGGKVVRRKASETELSDGFSSLYRK
jgi:hypothetical protein